MLVAALAPAGAAASERAGVQSTQLISRGFDGSPANGASTNPSISQDRRWARIVAFESEASNLVPNDTNGVKDVFVVKRDGVFGNDGEQWFAGGTTLLSRGMGGATANGPSWAAATPGAFRAAPRCVAFLSAASNLVPGDSNGKVDAFVTKLNGTGTKRVSLPGGRQSIADTTQVAVNGDCSKFAFTSGGSVYVRYGKRTKRLGPGADPSFSTGLRYDLVYGGPAGVYLSANGTGRPKLVVPGGSNPAYNDIKRRVVTYQRHVGGHWQVFWRDLGQGEHPASALDGDLGDGDSVNPMIANSGYYISFQSDASNLGVNSLGRPGDENGVTDAYMYTGVRNLTLVQSVFEKAVPLAGGGQNPSMSWYANYIVFDSPAPMGSVDGAHQIYMRYLGPV